MVVQISELKNVYIVISPEKKKVADYFDLKEINDKASVGFSKSMLNIGIEEQETMEFTKDLMPDLYCYVYLKNKEGNSALAVRVEDIDSGWKWVYEDDSKKGMLPVKWTYPNSKIDEFIKKKHKGKPFDREFLRKNFY